MGKVPYTVAQNAVSITFSVSITRFLFNIYIRLKYKYTSTFIHVQNKKTS